MKNLSKPLEWLCYKIKWKKKHPPLFGFLFLGALLGGCNPFMGYAPTSESILSKNYARNERKQPQVKVYCYSTLGENKCVSAPIEGKDHLLLGAYVKGEDDYKKEWWEKMALDDVTGISANTFRKELGVEPIPYDLATQTRFE
ncbi:MAG: hypothetical protein HEEMFOPI_00575 [Holosporales bacterium]